MVAIPDKYSGPTLEEEMYGTIEDPAWKGDVAKQYPFELDTFQKTAVACIVRSCDHLSAGLFFQ